ncbi:MAG TPA: hypothetical protein VII68_17485 [Casimicrobiaceae bacterium]|jgi:hypothetical protein
MSLAVVLGIALLVAYWAWIFVFFGRVRPRIMEALGRRLGVRVRESTDLLDAGTYEARSERTPLRKSTAISAVDLVVLLLGTVGVATLVFVPAFLVAESGALLPYESKLTGRGAELRVFDAAGMSPTDGKATLALDVRNTGREPLAGCVGAVEGYTSRNGYLHGATARFDLATGERRPVKLALEATRPPPGEHTFRLKLECANERIAVADAKLVVR